MGSGSLFPAAVEDQVAVDALLKKWTEVAGCG